MRLKTIKLAGFKSFVDPTTVSFPNNLSAVVGPNGCGKSNIIDAVRWVMGESSAKNLRGESMTDVIFNGSGGRKPVGQASIELVFDNAEGRVVGEYASYTEISVKRKVTRDSQNIYSLNGTKCRRKDITDLFLGTGLGPRSYAIIEQGMISRLIEAKPEELRVYIEEAAGISKYKERRRDTENRMRRTQENLERLTDLREELERQLVRLQRQANAAEKYKEYKEEERNLKALLKAIRYRELEQKSTAKKAEITELELKVEATVTDHVSRDAAIEKYRAAFTEHSDKFNEVQGRYYSVGADIARTEQSIQHVQDRERQLKIDIEQTERDRVVAAEHMTADQQKVEGWQAELLEIEPELELLSEAEQGSRERLLQAEEAMHDWQQRWDTFNHQAAEPKREAEVQQSRIQHLEHVQQRLLERSQKLAHEKQQLQLGDAEDKIHELQEQVDSAELQIEQKRALEEQLNEDLVKLKEKEFGLGEQLNALRTENQAARGRLSSLEALQQAALGKDAGGSSEWLERQGLADYPRLGNKLDVESGWEHAVETVLGTSLQAVCTESSLKQYLEPSLNLDKGMLALVGPDEINGSVSNNPELSLLAKVKSTINLAPILGSVYTAEDLNAATLKMQSLKAGESVITKDGLWLGSNWLRVRKEDDVQSGVIARKSEIDQLGEQLDAREADIEFAEHELAACSETISDKSQQLKLVRSEIDALSRSENEVRNRLTGLKVKIDQELQRKARLEHDIEEVSEQLESEAHQLTDARKQLEIAIEAMEKDSEERESLQQRREKLRETLDTARADASREKERTHQLQIRYQSIKTQLESLRQAMQRLTEQKERLEQRKQSLDEALTDCTEPLLVLQDELEAMLQKRLDVEEQLGEARKAVETAESSLKEVEKSRHEIEQKLNVLREELERNRLEVQALDVQQSGLQEQFEADEIDLEATLQKIAEDADKSVLENDLEQVSNRILRLGAINLAAIDEYKTESERKSYYDSQNDDLVEALETLEEAIKKIDRETRTRFKETFDRVNAGIQELFPKVFGGGHAYLELTGEDLLDTGIAIMARPPGKRNSTIHLLSGGEKALTAIALVFSIFRLNPAPFCMLDEVDAPLDDANVGRYARMVEEMSSQVQFIYITHNKIAMEMAHQLMGVTMHEPGVSRMVSVDVDEAAELAAL